MIRTFRGIAPKVALSAYVDPSAQIIGDVSSIWTKVSRLQSEIALPWGIP